MNPRIPLLLALLASPAIADEARQLDSHEHGVGELNIAMDGSIVAMEFHAPGADIVAFEYAPESEEDRAAVDAAVAMLARPLELFVIPAAAACSVTLASAELESDEEQEEHREDHDDQDNEKKHAGEAGHTEFHAEYMLTCGSPDALTEISFDYFEVFENAQELEVQIVSASGARAFEVERDDPTLDLRGMF